MTIGGIRAYPSGFELELSSRLRERAGRGGPFVDPMQLWAREPTEGLPDDLLRFGIEFADGSKVTSLSPFPSWSPDEPVPTAPSPVLLSAGGGGGDKRFDHHYWVWPLPPPGPLALVCEWPARGIPLTRKEIDSGPILAAADRAELLWDEPG